VVAHFPYDAPLLGAVAMAVDAAQGAHGRSRPDQDGRPQPVSPGEDAQDAIHQQPINTSTLS
jgi:hypothetical protein